MNITIRNEGSDPQEVVTVFTNDYTDPYSPVFTNQVVEAGNSVVLTWKEGIRFEVVPWHRLPPT